MKNKSKIKAPKKPLNKGGVKRSVRVLGVVPTGVCYNCLNGFHKGCCSGSSTNKCVCKDRKHDDSEWWVRIRYLYLTFIKSLI